MEILYEKLNYLLRNPQLITEGRLSIVNGVEDFTEYSPLILNKSKEFISVYEDKNKQVTCDISECIAKIILAESYYQADDCYNALIMTNSALAFLERKENVEIWVVAKYIQLCIMIVTGQLEAIFPLVDGMREDIFNSHNEQLIANYEALATWCALYDDDWKVIDNWMETKAPNEFKDIEFKDAVACFVKARVYYFQGKYYSLITLLQSLENTLKEKNRVMQLCELYMLMAMALYADNHKSEAFEYLNKIVDDCTQRDFVRLLADEGEPMYRMISEYMESCDVADDKKVRFLKRVKKASKNMAIEFPYYLKNHRFTQVNLTRREQEILSLLANGRSNTEIAEFFDCSINTVKYHLKNIFKKLGVNNRKDAVASVRR